MFFISELYYLDTFWLNITEITEKRQQTTTDFSGPDITSDEVSLHTPMEYFYKFGSEDMIQELMKSTNEYNSQKNCTSVNTDTSDIQKVIGRCLKMGLVQMAGVRMY